MWPNTWHSGWTEESSKKFQNAIFFSRRNQKFLPLSKSVLATHFRDDQWRICKYFLMSWYFRKFNHEWVFADKINGSGSITIFVNIKVRRHSWNVNMQWWQIENQQSPFYVVNRATLNHSYMHKSHSKALGFGLQTNMK